MLKTEEACKRISEGNYELTIHAMRRIVERNITREEISQCAIVGEVIENYPEDKYGPTCLILGWTSAQRPLHLHVSLLQKNYVKIITLYEPSTDEWEQNFTIRKNKL